jgi:hypothetical protein
VRGARLFLLRRRPRLDVGASQMWVTIEINLALWGMILCAAIQTGQRFAVTSQRAAIERTRPLPSLSQSTIQGLRRLPELAMPMAIS